MTHLISLRSILIAIALPWLVAGTAHCEVRPHGLIAEGMVLQRERPIRLWGTAAAAEKITVEFRAAIGTATADDAGKWQIELAAQPAGGPYALTIRGTNTIALKDVYVGEVWVCSGQSNMGWPVATRPGSGELLGTENPKIRLFTVPQQLLDEPTTDVTGSWQAAGPESLVGFSAVAYYFALDLESALQVPVGVIHASYGGSPVDQWIEPSALAAIKKPDAPPQRPRGRIAPPKSSRLYNSMIAPLVRYPIRGAIWYQGEADVPRAHEYEALFSTLIQSWRTQWNQGPFPFLYVQIAPYGRIVADPYQPSNSAALREAQLKTNRAVENTGMAVVTDWGHETDIHVKQKKPVGRRLALLARGLVYGEKDLTYAGPTLKKFEAKGKEAVLTFEHVGDGVTAKKMVLEDFSKDPRTGNGGALHAVASDTAESIALKGFAIAGPDGEFLPAEAVIKADKVVVSSPKVTEPRAVRYGWADYPTGNLFNSAGLPASPFRTDDWKLEPERKPMRVIVAE